MVELNGRLRTRLTGTGVVPPDIFTLCEADVVEIEITGIGRLRNQVMIV